MKVVHINRTDLLGSRFNGFALRELYARNGIAASHLVWNKLGTDPAAHEILPIPGRRIAYGIARKLEERLSLQSVLPVHASLLALQKPFREADLAHYHIIHDGYFSLPTLPLLSRLKPSVWTWHDPWIMAGHCIYPMDCTGWLTGCGSCPHLDRTFAMREDRTAEAFAMKQRVVERSKIDVVVASRFMQNMAKASPIGRHAATHLIPFGVDLDRYRPSDSETAKRRFGVLPDHIVLFARATGDSPYKGFDNLVAALGRIGTSKKLCLITVQETGRINMLMPTHQLIELGWTNDEDLMAQAFAAADIFLMPSLAEAFGLMAIEAMACGRPVIVVDGTSLPEVTFAPEVGVSVPRHDVDALASAITRLVENEDERHWRGRRGRELAEQHYGAALHVERMRKLYDSVLSSRDRAAA